MADLAKLSEEELLRCCGSQAWARKMMAAKPYKDGLAAAAEKAWHSLSHEDWLEAFSHHPKIGEKDMLREKFAATRQWAQFEQAGVGSANDHILEALAAGNAEYEKKFGYIFIVCATGKSATEMLAIIQDRLRNDRQSEIVIAAEEQLKITLLRLDKWMKGP